MGRSFQLLALVAIGLQALAVFVFGHLLSTLLDKRTHAKTSHFREKAVSHGGAFPQLGQLRVGAKRLTRPGQSL
jgi:hypothetical protein